MKKIFSYFQTNKKRSHIFAFVTLLVLALWIEYSRPSTSSRPVTETLESADTYIPKGFTLIPIDIANQEALESLVGSFGRADLYASETSGKNGKKIASFVRLMRAPLNPHRFAVLVPDAEASNIVRVSGPLFVSIRNPEHVAPKKEQIAKRLGRIQWEVSE